MPHVVERADVCNRLSDDPSVTAWMERGWHHLHAIIPAQVVNDFQLKAWGDARGWTERQAREAAARLYGGKCPGGLDERGKWFGINVQKPDAHAERQADFQRAWAAPPVPGVYRQAGVGVLGAYFPAIDVDIVDHKKAARAIDLLADVFGPERQCFMRFGNFPKFLMPFRWAEELGAVRAAKLVLPVTRETSEGQNRVTERIEVLGVGTQWVMEGWHAGAQANYRWSNRAPRASRNDRPHFDAWRPYANALPVLDRGALLDLMEALRGAVGLRGPAGRMTGRWTSGELARGPGDAQEEAIATAAQLRGLLGPEDMVWEAVRRIPNREEYGGYIHMLHAIKGASGGEAWGLDCYMEWSAQWPFDHPETNLNKWADLAPGTVHTLGMEWLLERAWGKFPHEHARQAMRWDAWRREQGIAP